MFKWIKSKKFPTEIFVVVAIANLIFVFFAYAFILALLKQSVAAPEAQTETQERASNNKYYLNEDYEDGDPLITKNPNLQNMLRGPIIGDQDPSLGPDSAPVNIVIFSDFRCSYCVKVEKDLQRIKEEYQDKVKFIWKDYPEQKRNSNSWQAALAARCAQEQNKFWPYHDLLYQNTPNLSQDLYMKLARDLDLDIKKFEECLQNENVASKIEDNILEADALEIKGVPFIYINDQEIPGNLGLKDLRRIVEIELSREK